MNFFSNHVTRIGTCGGRVDETGNFDYKISAGWDQCGTTQMVLQNEGQISICFDVSGDVDAVTNPNGLVTSRILSFKGKWFNDYTV